MTRPGDPEVPAGPNHAERAPADPDGTLTHLDGALTHLDAAGQARMVDVVGKDVTVRTATAEGVLETTEEVARLLVGGGVPGDRGVPAVGGGPGDRVGLPKGDALAAARIAGIMAAKRTADLIPLCHPVALHGVEVDLVVGTSSVALRATVRTADRTGVEMEALTAVAVAGLTLVDMVKALDRGARLTDIRVTAKSGGRSGSWPR